MNPADLAQSALPLPNADVSLIALFWQAHWIVKAVMLGLLSCSVWVWAIAVDKILLYSRTKRAMDRFELARHGEPVALFRAAQLESALVIGVQSDLLFSLTEQQAVFGMLESAGVAARFAPLACIEGHDAFLVDLKTFGREIGAFLKSS